MCSDWLVCIVCPKFIYLSASRLLVTMIVIGKCRPYNEVDDIQPRLVPLALGPMSWAQYLSVAHVLSDVYYKNSLMELRVTCDVL